MIYRRELGILLATAAMAISPVSMANAYPERAVSLIIAFTAGGSTDLIGREFAKRLGDRLGQSVVVENKPGAGGNIGVQYASKAAPDGYTLLMGNMGPLAVNPALMPNFVFNARKDLTPISPLVAAPNILVVGPNFPAKSFEEFKDWAKSQPTDSISYASTGVGTAAHLSSHVLSKAFNVPMLHIPYKGAAGLVDIAADRVHFTMATAPSVLSMIEGGKLRALLVTGDKRLPALPNVPAASEYGLEKVLVSAWYGVYGPPELAAAITERINSETSALLNSPEFIEKMSSLGAIPSQPETPQQYSEYVGSEIERMAHTVKEIGATTM